MGFRVRVALWVIRSTPKQTPPQTAPCRSQTNRSPAIAVGNGTLLSVDELEWGCKGLLLPHNNDRIGFSF